VSQGLVRDTLESLNALQTSEDHLEALACISHQVAQCNDGAKTIFCISIEKIICFIEHDDDTLGRIRGNIDADDMARSIEQEPRPAEERLVRQALVPVQEAVEIKNGKKVTVERKLYPGYVLVEMGLSQEALHLVNSIQGVIKFVGTGKLPQPLRQEEVNRLLGVVEQTSESEPKEEIPFLPGQVVEITEGPFSDFSGTVEEVLADKGKVKVSVSLFGRPTTVELDYLQLRGH